MEAMLTTGNPRGRPKKQPDLIKRMDALANELLDEVKTTDADGAKMPLANRIDLFKNIASWIAIRDRVDTPDDKGGEGLNAYRAKLAAGPADQRTPGRPGRSSTPKLDELKSRVPGAIPGGDGGNSGGFGGESVVTGGPDSGVWLGNVGGRRSESA